MATQGNEKDHVKGIAFTSNVYGEVRYFAGRTSNNAAREMYGDKDTNGMKFCSANSINVY